MKKNNFIILAILIMSVSFLFSDYAKLPIDNNSSLSNVKNKKPIKNKPGKVKDIEKAKNLPAKDILNQDLKAELMDLENEFKAQRQKLRQTYKQKRKAIYEKYGVKPPKKQRSETDTRNLKTK
jgi:flagellar biosynthesis component FlhA